MSTSANVVATLHEGEWLYIQNVDGTWSYAIQGNQKGYVLNQDLGYYHPDAVVTETEANEETEETVTEELKTGESLIEEARTEEIETEEVDEAEVETEEAQTEEAQTEEIETEEARTEEVDNAQVETEDAQNEEIETEEVDEAEVETEDALTEEIETEEVDEAEVETEDALTEEIETEDAQNEEALTEEVRIEEALPEETETEDAQSNSTVDEAAEKADEVIDTAGMRRVSILAPGEKGAAVYTMAGEGSRVLAVLCDGEAVPMVEFNDAWAKVVYDGRYAYIRTEDLVIYNAEEASEEEKQVFRTVTVHNEMTGKRFVAAGSSNTLTAVLTGFEDTAYTVQWFYSVDGNARVEIPGATELTYTFTVNATNIDYYWYVCVIIPDTADAEK